MTMLYLNLFHNEFCYKGTELREYFLSKIVALYKVGLRITGFPISPRTHVSQQSRQMKIWYYS